MANSKNLANAILAQAVSASDTSFVLETGYGQAMPEVPFLLTMTPFGQLSTAGNSEIVLVTARSGDTLSNVERGQKGTTAKAFAAGAVVSNGVYAEDIKSLATALIEWKGTVTGTIDGTNTTFGIADGYVAGTLQVFINGIAQSAFVNEVNPAAGTFQLDAAPQTSDDIKVQFQKRSTGLGNASSINGVSLTDLLSSILPIGATFVSGSDTLPALIASIGTWVRVEGLVIVGVDTAQTEFNTVNKLGGHKLMQSHNHGLNIMGSGEEAANFGLIANTGGFNNRVQITSTPFNKITSSTGGGNAQNLQPYKTKFMWERTA